MAQFPVHFFSSVTALTVSTQIRFHLNGESVATGYRPSRLLLDFLRRDQRQVGTKEGCREGDCGACAVLLGESDEHGVVTYRAVPSCMLMLGHVRNRHVVTIEGLRTNQGLNPIQQAVVDCGASQCGFCTPGFIVSFTGFVLNATCFSVEEATVAIAGNLCRCTGYVSLVRAAQAIVERFAGLVGPGPQRIAALTEAGVLPALFSGYKPEVLDHESHSSENDLLIGGGTDLIVGRGAQLDPLVPAFVLSSEAKRTIELTNNTWLISAGTTFEDLRRSTAFTQLWPGCKLALERFASTLIRERATVAGNIANASPIADGTAIFLALGARLELEGDCAPRDLALCDFFKAYKQVDLTPGERIARLRFPKLRSGEHFHFEKLSKREYLDIATVNSALAIRVSNGTIESVRLSAGGVAPIPLLLRQTAAFLVGKPLGAQTVIDAVPVLNGEIAPISDVRGSAEYKRLALRQLFFAHFLALFPGLVEERALLEVSR